MLKNKLNSFKNKLNKKVNMSTPPHVCVVVFRVVK